jgi:hypothetical protein
MTDDLKDKFERLVADPPPPSAVPSEAVFAKVRSVRRRRTAGVVTLVAAAVVAVAVAAGNLTDIGSSPPVSHTPSAPTTIVTGPPTTTPTATPTRTPTTGATSGTSPGTTTGTTKTRTPGSTVTTGPRTPPAKPIKADVTLKPVINGRTVTIRVTVSGTVLVPTAADGANMPADTSFLNLSAGTNYNFGDGYASGSDGGTVSCSAKSTKRTTGHETYPTVTYTYPTAGTYTFTYTVRYCGKSGWFPTTKTTQVVVR